MSTVPGAQATANVKIASSFSYDGNINATCDATALPGAMCTLSPANPIVLASGGTSTLVRYDQCPEQRECGHAITSKSARRMSTGAPNHSAVGSADGGAGFPCEVCHLEPDSDSRADDRSIQPHVQPVGSSFTGAVTLACSGRPSFSGAVQLQSFGRDHAGNLGGRYRDEHRDQSGKRCNEPARATQLSSIRDLARDARSGRGCDCRDETNEKETRSAVLPLGSAFSLDSVPDVLWRSEHR